MYLFDVLVHQNDTLKQLSIKSLNWDDVECVHPPLELLSKPKGLIYFNLSIPRSCFGDSWKGVLTSVASNPYPKAFLLGVAYNISEAALVDKTISDVNEMRMFP